MNTGLKGDPDPGIVQKNLYALRHKTGDRKLSGTNPAVFNVTAAAATTWLRLSIAAPPLAKTLNGRRDLSAIAQYAPEKNCE